MSDDGKPMSEWLNKVTRDQNAWSLSDLIVNRIDDARKWFKSQVISHNIDLGWYNPHTGKLVLGQPASTIDPDTINAGRTEARSVTSVNSALLLTVPAGYVCLLLSATVKNATRAYDPTLTIVADTTILYKLTNQTADNTSQMLIDQPYYWLEAGDTVTLGDSAFVAADAMVYNIHYVLFEVS